MSSKTSALTPTKLKRMQNALSTLAHDLGPDTSLRQVLALLTIKLGADAGADAETIVRTTGGAQSSVSRTMRKLAVELEVTRYIVNPMDTRRTLQVVTDHGDAVLTRAADHLFR